MSGLFHNFSTMPWWAKPFGVLGLVLLIVGVFPLRGEAVGDG